MLLIRLGLAQPPVDFELLVNRTHTERTLLLTDYYEEFSRYEDSTSIFTNIERVRALAKEHSDAQLMLEADLMEAHFHTYRYDKGWDSFCQHVMPLLSSGQHVPDSDWYTARMESMVGTVAYHYEQYEAAFIHYRRAVDILHDRSAETYPIKNTCSYLLAQCHYKFREYAQAARLFNHILRYPSSHDRYYYTMSAMNTLGMLYRNQGSLDSSYYWFEQVLDRAVAEGDSSYVRLIQGNLGENHYLQGDFERALPLMEEDLKLARANASVNPGHLSNSLYILGDMALEQGDVKKAETVMMEALRWAQQSKDSRRLQPIYPKVAKLYKAKGMPGLVLAYMDSAIGINAQVDREFDRLLSVRANQKLQMERLATEAAKLEGERKFQLLMRNVLLAVMALILVMLTFQFNRHRKAQDQRQLHIVAEKEKVELALQAASARMNAIVSNMQLKNQELEKARKELDALKEDVPERMKEHKMKLEAAVILTDQDWRDFMELFEVVNPGFTERLKAKYPDLTPPQVRFFVLCRLERSNKEMAAMLGVGTDAIRQMRSRMRKQLSLSSEQTIMALALAI